MRQPIFAIAGLALFATAAFAHSGVTNAAVKARMDLMGEIKDASGVLGGMARGKIAFDADKAAAAKASLIATAGQIPALFEAPEMDPKTEALPAIWDNWADFTAKADAMTVAAQALDVSSAQAIGQSMRPLGQSCGGCHKSYRIDK
jgi:cytochrome c556